MEALVTDLHPGTQRAHGRKFLDGDPDRLPCGRKTTIAQRLSCPTLALAHEQLGGYAVIECHSLAAGRFCVHVEFYHGNRPERIGRTPSERLLSQEGDRVGQDLVAGIELNVIARVGQGLDHKAFELDEFFLGHFFIDAQVPEKAITTLTRGFPLSSVSSCTWTRIITSGFFARAFAHSCSIISNFSVSVSICCINIPLSLPKIQSICLRSAANRNMITKMIAIAFLFVRLLYDCFKSRLAAASRKYWYCGISSMLCSSEHHVDCICVGPTVPYSFCLSSLSRILDTITIVRSETVVLR